jgi:3-isopropylmalate dehydrogenase
VLNLAVIGGDGTGPEVVAEGLKVLKAVAAKAGFQYKTTDFDLSGKAYLARGGDPKVQNIPLVTPEQIDELRKYDAIYLGAVGDPNIAPGIMEKGLLLHLRFVLDQYINLRPVKLYPGVESPLREKGPEHINFDVIRENTEDLYAGTGGFLRKGTPQEVSTQEMITTRFGAERCIRYAFEVARAKKKSGAGKGKLTLVHKTNVLTFCGDTWFRAFNEIGQKDYPDIERDYNHVDACCMWFVKSPEYYDTIVVPNMFGDIITDLAAMIQGGLGVAAGGNVNPQGVSMFEPMGGSAPKYSGQNVINPIAAIAAMGMLLRVVGGQKKDAAVERAGNMVEEAIKKTCRKMKSQSAGKMGYGTSQVGDLVCAAL